MKKHSILLLSVIVFISAVSAQIPNAGFESWDTTGGYKRPSGWDNMNLQTKYIAIYTCTEGTPGGSGTGYLMLMSRAITGMGVVPGVASPGVINKYDMSHPIPQSGFPYSLRPIYLSGMCQYMPTGMYDHGYISVLLSKWDSTANKRDTVASINYKLMDMAMTWRAFSIRLNYQSLSTPDSAIIMLSSSGLVPAAGSYLFVDDLAFTDTTMSTGVSDINSLKATVEIFPNPASSHIMVKVLSNIATIQNIQLTDMTGRLIQELSGNNSDTYSCSTEGLSKGCYLIKLLSKEGITVRKVVIE